MFKKILIAEDFQDTNKGIVNALENRLQIEEIQEELYCDKAYNRFKLAFNEGEPYELLITDLSFKEGPAARKLTSGQALIKAVRDIDPNIKVIVNSMIDNPVEINPLFTDLKINAYVCKGRNGLNELVTAIQEAYQNRTYVSPQINLNSANTIFELDKYDRMILQDLAEGLTKKEISEKLKRQNISPNSESTIDKKVSRLFDAFGAKNIQHLIAKLIKEGRI
ncbi:response regulator transcription factor [Zobellia galactanivorans]|uniref:Two-component system-Response regulator n=2 Tax=Zobellia TaxID=112040 RepID=G0LBP6_ZOBGA|nr:MULTISPECIES: response regulator transcription factor [Zobellia]MBU3026130.1 DNA-binding response regulator [Zobellia galactanivorans]MDO6517295.1 response regulator transcription factor [Zobellia uliginosa]MDO6807394.1 response regulator transcription factor [Zobellia galactanivorans]OWW27216.1 DNA-binding response regulator [Zobellia sp. OII3]CAZ96343.1 Two-component system-Response regulator [Zobellia galactanivorans]